MTWRARGVTATVAIVVGGVLAGCTGPSATDGATPPTAAGTPTEAGGPTTDTARPSGHVVAISVDGLKPGAIRALGPDGAPALHRMLRQGAGTLNARTLRENTQTLPNHTGMLTGRRATGPGGHGIMVNRDPGGTVHDAARSHVDSMFTVVHDRGGSTALYAAKPKFALFDRTWAAGDGGPDRTGDDDGTDKIDRFTRDTEAVLVRDLLGRLRDRPDTLSFLHLGLPDAAGHVHGFGSARYLAGVRRADALVGRILRTIAGRATLRRTTTVVLTADHGGRGRDHRFLRRPDFTVPFLVWGAQVARGADLYRLNPEREEPGTARTDYRGVPPVRNGDVANLATGLLGLPPVPGSHFGREQRLRVDR